MAETADLPYLSASVLDGLALGTRDIIEAIEQVLRGRARGVVWNAPKSVILTPDGRYVMGTLAAGDDPPYLVMKSLIVNPHNAARGLPGIHASVTLSDSTTGRPLAFLDGNWITAVRTAGLSAVAAARLARPDAASVAFIGCGVQALAHLRAFREIFPLEEIHAFGRGTANRDALCAKAEDLGLRAHKSATARDAVSRADLIVTSVTLSPPIAPFLDARWLRAGTFAAITDLAIPWQAEGMVAFDCIVIDDREQEENAERPLVTPALISGDLCALAQGSVSRPADPGARTAFVFRGLALGDLAVAALAYDRYVQR